MRSDHAAPLASSEVGSSEKLLQKDTDESGFRREKAPAVPHENGKRLVSSRFRSRDDFRLLQYRGSGRRPRNLNRQSLLRLHESQS